MHFDDDDDQAEARRLLELRYRLAAKVAENDRQLSSTPTDLGLWLDSSEQTPEETVEEIIARSDEARVDGRQVASA